MHNVLSAAYNNRQIELFGNYHSMFQLLFNFHRVSHTSKSVIYTISHARLQCSIIMALNMIDWILSPDNEHIDTLHFNRKKGQHWPVVHFDLELAFTYYDSENILIRTNIYVYPLRQIVSSQTISFKSAPNLSSITLCLGLI